jgi:uncharacterized protein
MFTHLPELLDPRKACAQGEAYRGDLPLAGLRRLAGLADTGQLARDQGSGGGQVAYRLSFRRDDSGRDLVLGSVRGQLRLCCQRCGQPFDLAVDADLALAVVAGIDEAEALPDAYDPLLLETPLIRPRDLIEDELILAVPAVPRHAEGSCAPPAFEAAGEDALVERPSPFAALAALKRGQGQPDEDD